jgi:hypothetical protein
MSNKLTKPDKPGDFMMKYSPGSATKLYKSCYNIEACIRSGAPALSTARREHGQEFITTYLETWIVNLNDFLSIKTKMTPPQIRETAEMIYQDNYFLNIADLRLIFKNFKSGKYPLFESLDGMKLMAAFNAYSNERQDTSHAIGGPNKSEKMDLGKAITDREDFKKIGHGSEKN